MGGLHAPLQVFSVSMHQAVDALTTVVELNPLPTNSAGRAARVVRLASDVAFLFKTDKTGLTLAATTLALCPASETVLLNVGVGDARSLYLAGLGAAGTIVITPVDNY